jgi:A/G-specific adenine glycosylase
MSPSTLHDPVLNWFAVQGRDLPWRKPGRTPWGVLVSEFMLQQTPVSRVLPIWTHWLHRWPEPADLAAGPPADAIRAWGRLGYPRRALRLHATAGILVDRHGGAVPADPPSLRQLPGVGEYTAAAVACFAFGDRQVVLDTNVRRVLARLVTGQDRPTGSVTVAERALARELLPGEPDRAVRWAAGIMELGALICTSRSPDCPHCPVRDQCRWRRDGRPAGDGTNRRSPPYHGTDRFVRGLLLAALRDSDRPLTGPGIIRAVPDDALRDPGQRDRCLDSLVADGLVEPMPRGRFRLPSGPPRTG